MSVLLGSVADEDVDPPELGDGGVDDSAARIISAVSAVWVSRNSIR